MATNGQDHARAPGEGAARDTLGRPLRDLRISVTDRCNLRCTYCMPADKFPEHHAFLPRAELLTFDEITRVARAGVALGVRKIRLTGGEPLLRRDLSRLVAQLAALPGVEDVALTTNGLLLAEQAEALRAAGLHRLTVSLDTLDEAVLRRMNGAQARVAPVLAGIAAARAAGFPPPKINVVVQRGVNDHTLLDLVAHFRGTGCALRFIEYMDVGTLNAWERTQVLPSAELLARIDATYPVRAVAPTYRGEVARRYAFADGQGEIGFISSVTQPFCGDCSRLRLASDGDVYTCLFATHAENLKPLLRAGATDAALVDCLRRVWTRREDRYSELRAQAPAAPKVEMYHVGG